MFRKFTAFKNPTDELEEFSPENGETPESRVPASHHSSLLPPAGDGSEEFFEQFTDREDRGLWMPSTRALLMGAGVVVGVVAGASLAYWLIRERRRKPWWQRLLRL